MKPRAGTALLMGGVAGLIAALGVSPPGIAATPSTHVGTFDGLQVVPSCQPGPFGLSFQFLVVNRRSEPVDAVRLDVYFRRGARLHPAPGFASPPLIRIEGSHVWEAAESLNVSSGFAVQPILHEDAKSQRSSYHLTFTLTVEGARQSFRWVCARR
jgi:hypothetical protein